MYRNIASFIFLVLLCQSSLAIASGTPGIRDYLGEDNKVKSLNIYQENYYYGNSPYSDFSQTAYILLGYYPDEHGIGVTFMFHNLDPKTKKFLLNKYSNKRDQVINAPLRYNEVSLDDKQFLTGQTITNVRYLSINLPVVPKKLALKERITSINKSKTITIDAKLPRPDKDARKHRTDWINHEYFSKYSLPDYRDQVSLLIIKTPTPAGNTTHGIRGGCLSSKKSGKISNITISRLSDSEKPGKFELVKLDYKMPVFNATFSFLTRLQDTVIDFDNTQVDVVVECTTTKGAVFINKKTVTLTKPKKYYSESYK